MNAPVQSTVDHVRTPVRDDQLPARLRALRDALTSGLVERDVAVRLALLAALAGEHIVMHGPPGTGKSLVARRLQLAFRGATYFERLLTRFSVPEELFGPLSIKGLEEDRYQRLTEGYLPTASVAFLDEIFKANSAILNALLTLLNEREFDNGAVRESVPLVSVVAASNELPEGDELAALFDRFLMRLHVGPVSKSGFTALLQLRGNATPSISPSLTLSDVDLARVQALAAGVTVPVDVETLLTDLRDWCTAEKIEVSDRRWRKVVKLLQVSAVTNGREEVSIWDAWLLQHCLWNEPEQREKVFAWYGARVGATRGMDPSRLTKLVTGFEAQLNRDSTEMAQARDSAGNLLYQEATGEQVNHAKGRVQRTRGGESLYLAPVHTAARPGYRDGQLINDRTNKGQGYTRQELGELTLWDAASRREADFNHWLQADAYCENLENWLMQEANLPPVMEPLQHKRAYLENCLSQVDTLRADIESYQEGLKRHLGDLESLLQSHLWVTSDFVAPAGATLRATQSQVDSLLGRVAKLREGFEELPRETQVAAL